MSHLLVWITRPGSYEVLMHGDRHLSLWTERPRYSHSALLHDLRGRDGAPKYKDQGWLAHRQHFGAPAKPLLKQSQTLRDAVWDQVFLSLCPKGLDLDRGRQWSETPRGDEVFDGHAITLWHELIDDRGWEGKCNTAHKRFLLEVDLLTQTVRRIAPLVVLRRGSTDEPPPDVLETDAIDPALAVEVWHTGEDPDRIPF